MRQENRNSKTEKWTEYRDVATLPGVSQDLVSAAALDNGFTIVGWDESSKAWADNDVCYAVLETALGPALVLKMAPAVDPAFRAAFEDEKAYCQLAWTVATVGVMGLTEDARDPKHRGETSIVGESAEFSSDGTTPLGYWLQTATLDPKRSGRNGRLFSFDEKMNRGRFAGHARPVFRPKQVSANVIRQLLNVAVADVTVKRQVLVATEVTRAMWKHNDERVSWFIDREQALTYCKKHAKNQSWIRVWVNEPKPDKWFMEHQEEE